MLLFGQFLTILMIFNHFDYFDIFLQIWFFGPDRAIDRLGMYVARIERYAPCQCGPTICKFHCLVPKVKLHIYDDQVISPCQSDWLVK